MLLMASDNTENSPGRMSASALLHTSAQMREFTEGLENTRNYQLQLIGVKGACLFYGNLNNKFLSTLCNFSGNQHGKLHSIIYQGNHRLP